jgi:hypothetical protein
VFIQNSVGTEYARFDASGNFGIGTTPSSWNSSAKVMDIATASSVVDYTAQTWLVNNLYLNSAGNWTYKTTNASGLIAQTSGQVIFYRTASGTAGNTATLIETARIDTNGNVGVNETVPSSYAKMVIKQTADAQTLYLNSNQSGFLSSNQPVMTISTTNGTANPTASYAVRAYYNSTEIFNVRNDGLLQFNSGFGSAATAYGCRAWVNFNGTTNTAGFCTIRASGGVTSVADNGTGDYTINFSFTMPDANYAIVGTAKIVGGVGGQNIRIHNDAYTTSVTTSAVKVQVTNSGNSAMADSEMVNIAVFR